jgi:MFS superfamily sulfate permease-like transporter
MKRSVVVGALILSGLLGGFLVVGSLSKTSVAIAAGARTQLANLVAAVFCFLTLVLLTPLFRGMPHPALAAIVIAAMLHLSKPVICATCSLATLGNLLLPRSSLPES